MTQILKLGVIGCGRIAQVAHLPAIAKVSAMQLVAVSDPSPVLCAGVARRYEVPGYLDTQELLEQDLDAVLVAVPDRFHLQVGAQALQAGKHVLMEKPAAATAAEGAELQQLAEKAQRTVQIGAMRRHDPGLHFSRRAIEELGPLLTANLWYRLPAALRTSTEAALFPAVVADETVRANEAQFKADRVGYLLRTHGAHVFDTARYLFGDVTAVRAELRRSGADLNWHGVLEAARAPVSFDISANVHGVYSEGAEIFGERGQISIRSFFPFTRQSSIVRVFSESTLQWQQTEYGAVDPYERQLAAFAHATLTGSHPDPDADAGVAALRLIEATARSVAEDGRISC